MNEKMSTEDVIEWLESLNYDMGEETQEVAEAINIAIRIIKTKTKKGKWVFENRKRLIDENDEGRVYMYDQWWKCSECHYDYGYKKPEFKFCPNCGAEMEDIDETNN